ncbi:MAG: hypothetical protein OHK0037_10410 [Elainellaceae cyanobacterium]
MPCTAKKTVALIVEQQQHYLIALKANQPSLHNALEHLHHGGTPLSQAQTIESEHNRQVHRQVWVYEAPAHLQSQWVGLKRLIWVERGGTRDGKSFHQQVGYLTA